MQLRQYLSENNLTAKSFSDLLGVSEFTVGKWVRGERIPRPEVMRKIAEVTNGKVRADDFFGIEGGCNGPHPERGEP